MLMSSNARPCPIWKDAHLPRDIVHGGNFCDYPRAGGRFVLEHSGALELKSRPLTDKQKANLSYWIYHHSLRYRLFDESPGQGGKPLVLDQALLEDHRDRMPSSEDRLMMFLREVIRSDDAGEDPGEDFRVRLHFDSLAAKAP